MDLDLNLDLETYNNQVIVVSIEERKSLENKNHMGHSI